ncbi:MAG: hypothetical protein COV34_01395 [Candidatus Zambryskibacteria bacterium CG10_big_fil_rev_8_21_14_0_10_42_12]|uniref:Ribosome-binding factor A n=1 Tax=Candidatus Zambryskibacteria bacterium CG10_big_fil_rev_8_21_14_0_10_42_12 TaxID=1975115 RepID=A0A2H0QVF8_9BACT|nr:MAG: hypothetical protein COV34_01395 [Candidatus Zambryskibacteria bacterium CG10_big_fil_rev_8_21_14_0_10_42_12]
MLTPEQKAKKDEQLTEAIRKSAALFFEQESNRKSLITVTRVLLSSDKKKASVMFTVFPESYEEQASLFANRNRRDFVTFLKSKYKVARLPSIDFHIDQGEKNRQRIDMLLSKEHDNLESDTDTMA